MILIKIKFKNCWLKRKKKSKLFKKNKNLFKFKMLFRNLTNVIFKLKINN